MKKTRKILLMAACGGESSDVEPVMTPEPTPTPDPDSKVEGERSAVITSAFTGGTANLREGPSTVYKILGVLKRGDRITVIEESDDWYLIRTEDGTEGYVSGYYVSFE